MVPRVTKFIFSSKLTNDFWTRYRGMVRSIALSKSRIAQSYKVRPLITGDKFYRVDKYTNDERSEQENGYSKTTVYYH